MVGAVAGGGYHLEMVAVRLHVGHGLGLRRFGAAPDEQAIEVDGRGPNEVRDGVGARLGHKAQPTVERPHAARVVLVLVGAEHLAHAEGASLRHQFVASIIQATVYQQTVYIVRADPVDRPAEEAAAELEAGDRAIRLKP